MRNRIRAVLSFLFAQHERWCPPCSGDGILPMSFFESASCLNPLSILRCGTGNLAIMLCALIWLILRHSRHSRCEMCPTIDFVLALPSSSSPRLTSKKGQWHLEFAIRSRHLARRLNRALASSRTSTLSTSHLAQRQNFILIFSHDFAHQAGTRTINKCAVQTTGSALFGQRCFGSFRRGSSAPEIWRFRCSMVSINRTLCYSSNGRAAS